VKGTWANKTLGGASYHIFPETDGWWKNQVIFTSPTGPGNRERGEKKCRTRRHAGKVEPFAGGGEPPDKTPVLAKDSPPPFWPSQN